MRINAALQIFAGANGAIDLRNDGRFVWYELMTTDIAAARAFYSQVTGWAVQDASTPDLAYNRFATGGSAVGGLMELPEAARKMGATPRWMGYVGVSDIKAATDHITPPDQVYALADYASTAPEDVVRRLSSGGHLGLFMGHEALAEQWPPLLAAVLERSLPRRRSSAAAK